MPSDSSRREFLTTATLAAAAAPAAASVQPPSPTPGREASEPPPATAAPAATPSPTPLPAPTPPPRLTPEYVPALAARPFPIGAVRVRPGLQADAMAVNRRYMMGLAPDRLLHNFRVNAGLPSSAQPFGGWEAPVNELRGHFTGHYLSGTALFAAHHGDDEVKARGALIVSELAKVQMALGGGYLSAFPLEFFDRLKARVRVWAPFYTYHKIMLGLLDTAVLSRNDQALTVVRGMADWVKSYSAAIPDETWYPMLETEYGGMNDILRELSQVTGDKSYAELARRFDHERIFGPLAVGRDELKDVHANTQVPKILGVARNYEMTGDDRARAICDFFWEDITGRRSYATGGTTNGERWQNEPGQLAKALGSHTQETCVTYNMLKLTRHKFSWSPEARFADFYERAYWNGILGTQHPKDGEKVYYTPLADGYWKLFGTPDQGFWCCHGSGVETFSKLGDSVYFHDDTGIYVNLFVPSSVGWAEKGLRLTQDTAFPASDTASFTITADKPVAAALRVRVPYWAASGGAAKLNGRVLDAFAGPSSYLVVNRTWRTGDKLEVTLPMSLHAHRMPDDHTLQAVMYGPLVLVGRLSADPIPAAELRAEPTAPRTVPNYKTRSSVKAPAIKAASLDPSTWLKPVPGAPLTFKTVGQEKEITFAPLYTVFDERYATYFRVTRV